MSYLSFLSGGSPNRRLRCSSDQRCVFRVRNPQFRRLFFLGLLPLLILGCGSDDASHTIQIVEAHPEPRPTDIEPEAVAEDLPRHGLELTLPKAPRRFFVDLTSQDYFEVVIEQRGIDVEMSLSDPHGQELLHVDSPNGPAGNETLAVVAAVSGRYVLTIYPEVEHSGRQVRLGAIIQRPAGEADRHFARILRHHHEPLLEDGKGARHDQYLRFSQHLAQLLLQDRPLFQGRIERMLGLLCLADGRVQDALGHLERALPLIRRESNDWELAPLLNDMGYAARLAGEPKQARASFEESLRRSEALGHELASATALNNLGVLYEGLGELEHALSFYDRSASSWRRLERLEKLATTLHNIGLTYISLGRMDHALGHLEQALELRRGAGDERGEAVTLASIGWARSLEGDHACALDLFDQSLELRRALGDRSGEAVTLDQRGGVLRALGRDLEAIGDFERALSLLDTSGNRVIEAHLLANLGEVLLAVGRPVEALERQRAALALFRAVDDRQGEARALIDLAAVERRRNRPDVALEHYERAFELFDSVRGRLQSTAFRRSYFAARYPTYSAYIDLLLELDVERPDEGFGLRAFHALERVRARSLRERLGTKGSWWRGADPVLLAAEQSIRERINLLEGQRLRALKTGTDGGVVGLDQEIEALVAEYEKLEGRLWRSSGHEASPSRALRLHEIQAQLDAETTLLVYHLGEREVVWLIEHERWRYWPIERAPQTVSTEVLAGRTRRSLAASGGVGRRGQADADAKALAERVLAPVVSELGRRVVVVASGALATVPFGTLPIEATRFLVERHEVAYLPSASVLPLLRGPRSSEKLLAVLADPVFKANDRRLTVASSSSRGPGAGPLPRLPHAGAEAAAVFALAEECVNAPARCLMLTGAEASRSVVLDGQLANYRLIHFATHGWVDDRHSALSGIVLSRFDAVGQPQEGFLRVHEIERLHLSADLVVLSACRTALGDTVRGEGVVGMAQAFFRAGARRLLVSHWQVDDRSTAALMERFYHHLLVDGQSPTAALAGAQRWMQQDTQWQAPYYWGAFALQGDWR